MPMATSPDAIETRPVPQGALSGRCLVIIGGTQGLGWSAAQACLREGAQLVVVGLEPTPEFPQTETVQDRLEVILADAREPGVAERAIERCAQRYGQFHALYHVAGGSGRAWGDGPLHTIPLEGWQRTLELNLTTAFLSNGAAIRWFLRENQPGCILNCGSVLASSPSPNLFGTAAYATAKSALVGLTQAAAAAYARRGGMRAFVLIPDGYVAQGKLAQALLYGAEVLAVKGNFDRALAIVREVADQYPVTLVNSLNPYRLQGQKTAAFEVVDALGEAPDWLCIPVGNAGNISAYWMGFNEYKAAGHSRRLPRMMGFQAAGAAPLVLGHTVDQPDTIATAIRIGNPVNKENALKARAESNGDFMAVTDAEIIDAYKLLGSGEGVFCEPASAASVAGLIKRREEVPAGATVVCVLTGNGLKDPTTAIEHNDSKFHTGLDPDTDIVARVMGF